jgi:hypothetical protein
MLIVEALDFGHCFLGQENRLTIFGQDEIAREEPAHLSTSHSG